MRPDSRVNAGTEPIVLNPLSAAPDTVALALSYWADFTGWCQAHRLSPLPTALDTVAMYLSDRRIHPQVQLAPASALRDLSGTRRPWARVADEDHSGALCLAGDPADQGYRARVCGGGEALRARGGP